MKLKQRMLLWVGLLCTATSASAAACVLETFYMDFNNDGVDERIEVDSCFSGYGRENAGRVIIFMTLPESQYDYGINGLYEEQQLGIDHAVIGPARRPVLTLFSLNECVAQVFFVSVEGRFHVEGPCYSD